jgi:ubiquinone/menaquinone biosynthesis C-methylase UbiE/NAD-dependent dihydropyrimidine dehydrogenase PreA subunit
VIDDIVAIYIRPGMHVLDVGCGTGALAAKAADADARVTGLDISEGMLAVAKERIRKSRLKNKVDFQQAGVVEMDMLFHENSFDCVTSTLTISELYGEERKWALREFHRVLKPGGKLIIAGEVKPKQPLKKAIYSVLRLPLALITYAFAQTGTKAVSDIHTEIHDAGFDIIDESKSFLESFVTIMAKKVNSPLPTADAQAIVPCEDKSVSKTLFDYCGRWFPNPVEPGLRIIGTPDRTAPVIVTANFHLTVRRVEKALAGIDCYLIVVPTKGINVWCASAAGEMNTHSIVTALKTSRIGERVDHRVLVLPQFSAPGIDLKLLKKRNGWNGKWGPAYARDLPLFLKNGYTKPPQQCIARFPLSFRMEMLIAMNVSMWMVLAAIALAGNPAWALITSVIFWGAGLILYAGYPLLPFKSGWLKALMLDFIVVAGFIAVSVQTTGSPWHYAGWMIFACLAIAAIGFDLRGIVGDRTSEAEAIMHKLGFETFAHFFRAKGVHMGHINQDKSKCINCNTCRLVCPMGVFGLAGNKKDIIIGDGSACLKCNACVRQCIQKALFLN